MKFPPRFLTLLAAVLAISSQAVAHGAMEHILGTVTSKDATSFTVKQKDGSAVTVDLDEKTQFEKAGKPAAASDLDVGDRVAVHAKKSAAPGHPVAHLVKLRHVGK